MILLFHNNNRQTMRIQQRQQQHKQHQQHKQQRTLPFCCRTATTSLQARALLLFLFMLLVLQVQLQAHLVLGASAAASSSSETAAATATKQQQQQQHEQQQEKHKQRCDASISGSSATTPQAPYVRPPSAWLPASVDWQSGGIPLKDVLSYARPTPSCDARGFTVTEPVAIGQMPQFRESDTLRVLDEAARAWRGGTGRWTALSLPERVDRVRALFRRLQSHREAIVTALQWEIGKNRPDAEAEFDRTVQFAETVMETVLNHPEYGRGAWQNIPGSNVEAVQRRHAIGIILALAPYNYPLNESYAAIIPALLLGNIVILKIPAVGGLVHLITMDAVRETLPAGTLNFVAGGGRATMPPLMASGQIDGLAFIGGSQAADQLIHRHPHPHRLKVFLQLEAKNMAVLLDDVFTGPDPNLLLDNAVRESVSGGLSYNGQRCTALKLFFAPARHADAFVERLVRAVDALPVGLPWQTHGGGGDDDGGEKKSASNNNSSYYSQITPLPNPGRVAYMRELLADAVEKGARIVNENGGQVVGGGGDSSSDGGHSSSSSSTNSSTLMIPAVVYPVTPDMRLFHEEQFGPIVPIATYDSLEETVVPFARDGPYAQQVSIFGQDVAQASNLIDRFSAIFGKINLNQQCGRSPDTLPFSGRRSSALGVMSVSEALREFSVPTVIAHKNPALNGALVRGVSEQTKFLESAGAQKMTAAADSK